MTFDEKLNFLFDISHAEGKELANAMNITPPQISKMRKGYRGFPKDETAGRNMARFFARHCGSALQREALSQKMHVVRVESIRKESEMTDLLYEWLSDTTNNDDYVASRADIILQKFEKAEIEADDSIEQEEPMSVSLTSSGNTLFTFYGNEGKRQAAKRFMNYIAAQQKPYIINTMTDEDMDWVIEDESFEAEMRAFNKKLCDNGCISSRITAEYTSIEQAFNSFNNWFPLYFQGKATSYYYRRMRDNVYHITLFVVKNVASMFTFSVGKIPSKNQVTLFTADPKTAESLYFEFEKYRSMCEPTMRSFTIKRFSQELSDTLESFDHVPVSTIEVSSGLSLITLPWDVVSSLDIDAYSPNTKKDFLIAFAKRNKNFKQSLYNDSFVDIISLATVDEIMNGSVQIPSITISSSKPMYYKPSTYLLHLRRCCISLSIMRIITWFYEIMNSIFIQQSI